MLIIDAGGSTVEMTAYRILRVLPLRFEEVSRTSSTHPISYQRTSL